jgi:prevent-host-death family protein
MKQFTATEAKNNLGQIFDAAQAAPVRITKNGKDFVVVLLAAQFEKLNVTGDVRPDVRDALNRSMARRADVYAALAR